MFASVLQKSIVGLLTLVLFVPFLVTGSFFFPFITGKAFAFRMLVEIAFLLYVILALREPSVRPRRGPILYSLILFIFVMMVTDILGENPARSFWSNYERMEGLVSHLHLFAFFLMISHMFREERNWSKYFHTSIFASILISFYGLLQLAGKLTINQGGVRVDATFGNATYLAVYMLFHLFLTAYYLWRNRENGPWVPFYGIALFLQLVMLYNTATRGAILGFIGGLFLTTLLIAFREKGRVRTISICVIGGVAAVILVFFLARNTSFVTKSQVLGRFSQISLNETTTQSRFIIWKKIAFEGFKEHPILGWGQENYNIVFNKYYRPELWRQEAWFDRAHNIFLDWLIAGGILGILSYLLLFGTAYYVLWKLSSLTFIEKSLFAGLLAGYLFQNAFVFDNLISYVLFFSILSYLHFLYVAGKVPHAFSGKPSVGLIHDLAVSLSIVLFFASFYLVNVKPALAARALIQALSLQPEDGILGNKRYFEKALSYKTFGNPEIREQLVQIGWQVQRSDLPPNIKQEFFAFAKSEMEEQFKKVPTDARFPVFLSTLLLQNSEVEGSILYAERARQLSPNKQSIFFQLGSAYLSKRDYGKALEIFKQAYDLDTSYDEARMNYVVSLIFVGKDNEADKLLTEKYGSSLVHDQRLLSAYTMTKKYGKVIAILEKQIKETPNNAQTHLSLAAAYYASGARTKAVKEVEEAVKIDPSYKEQSLKVIEDIKSGKLPIPTN